MEILRLTLPLFALVLLGYAASRFLSLKERTLRALTFYVVYLALPALLFQLVRAVQIDLFGQWRFIAATSTGTLLTFVVAYAIGRYALGHSANEAPMIGVAGAYANVGYMGPALTIPAFGEAAAAPTALVLCFDNVLMFTLVPLLVAMSGSGPDRSAARALGAALIKVVTHPFLIASALGFLAAHGSWTLPTPLNNGLALLAASAAPCALFAMGVVIASHAVTLSAPNVLPITGVKLLLHPLLVWLCLSWVGGIDPLWIGTAVLMASLPCALNVFVFANQYKTLVEDASAIVVSTTCASAITVTGFLLFWL